LSHFSLVFCHFQPLYCTITAQLDSTAADIWPDICTEEMCRKRLDEPSVHIKEIERIWPTGS
jgi:hypothetical protein